MMNPAPACANTIRTESYADGRFLTTVLNLGDPGDADAPRILRVLSVLFGPGTGRQKAGILEQKFDMSIGESLLKEIENMGPFQEWHDADVRDARIENYTTFVRRMMVNEGMTKEKAIVFVGVPEDILDRVVAALDAKS